MNLCQLFKNRNLLGTDLDAFSATNTLSAVDLTQSLIILNRMIPGSLTHKVVIDFKNLRNGNLLGTHVTVVTAGAGNQHLLAQRFTSCQNRNLLFLLQHARMGLFRNGHVLLYLACFIHAA